MWGTGSIVVSSITASMLRLVASFFLCFGALHFPSGNSLKNAWKRYSFNSNVNLEKGRNCHERSMLNLKFIKITLALWFSPHSFTTLIPKTSQSPQAHRAEVNLREKSQAPWVQKVPYFVRIQTYPNCNICNFAPQLQELVEGCGSIWSVTDCWSTKLSPAMHLQACSNVARQWHCILPDRQSLKNSKNQGREDPTPPQKEVEATWRLWHGTAKSTDWKKTQEPADWNSPLHLLKGAQQCVFCMCIWWILNFT